MSRRAIMISAIAAAALVGVSLNPRRQYRKAVPKEDREAAWTKIEAAKEKRERKAKAKKDRGHA